jgi:hypothetical protein
MKVEYRDEALTIGTSGRVFAIVWKGEATLDRVRAIAAVSRRAYPQLQSGFAMIVLLEDTTTTPDAESRRLLSDLMKELASGMRAVAYVVPGAGFAAAAKRAVITGLSLAARPPYPVKVFQSLEHAEQYIAPLLPAAPPPGEAERLVTELRREGPAVPV